MASPTEDGIEISIKTVRALADTVGPIRSHLQECYKRRDGRFCKLAEAFGRRDY